MGVSSSQLHPQKLISFKKLPTDVSLASIEIPERPENRRQTNQRWLIVFPVVIALFLPFLIYTLCHADLARLSVGYDQCGNVCGQTNYQWDNIPCSGKDMTRYPYLQYDRYIGGDTYYTDWMRERDCVPPCQNGYSWLSRPCKQIETEEFGIAVIFDNAKWQIVISCLLSILVAMGMVFLFRYAVAFVVWFVLIGSLIGLLIVVVYLWSVVSYSVLFKAGAIMFTIIAIVLGVIIIWCRKKIRLVITLLKEANKAIIDMPGLITLPVICVISILILAFVFGLIAYSMTSAGTLEQFHLDFYYYKPNPVMKFAKFYNLVVFLWIFQFFTGIQYMVIAGAVSKWYFTRDKGFLGTPIITSVSNTFRFHLGTVALGSLSIALVRVIKQILGLLKNRSMRRIVCCCVFDVVESFFKVLSKNAYIITAMHGQPFIRSGARAAKLIILNISDIIGVNSIWYFVLGMVQFLIIVITFFLSIGIFAMSPIMNPYSVLFVIAIFACIVAWTTFGVFETTIDTLFICYCEDRILNDGMERPYFMSRNLMEFMQDSKKVYRNNKI